MPSQNEIARRTGVSQSLVSRVLNGRAAEFGIADDTAARVLAVATELGYRPNPAASILLGGASRLIGVVVRSFDDPFLATILQELNRRALEAGCNLLVAGLEGDDRKRRDEIRQLQRYRPDALIVVGTTDFRGWAEAALLPGQPVVQIGLPSAAPGVISCGIDEKAAADAIVQHLHTLGHTRLAIVGDNSLASTERARLLGEALRRRDESLPRPTIFLSEQADDEAGRDAARWFLERGESEERPGAVIATGDLIALGLVRALDDAGVLVPDAVSVASYDDVPVAALMRPALTTIRQPARELAAAAMELATSVGPQANVQLPGELIVRESTRAMVMS